MTDTDPKPRKVSTSPQGTDSTASNSESENPALPGPTPRANQRPRSNRDWWPNQVDLQVLDRTDPAADPMGEGFDYKEAVQALDAEAVKADIVQVMHTSQEWWPADHGHYGPLFIRMVVARGRHVPRGRRPGRRGQRRAALRPMFVAHQVRGARGLFSPTHRDRNRSGTDEYPPAG